MACSSVTRGRYSKSAQTFDVWDRRIMRPKVGRNQESAASLLRVLPHFNIVTYPRLSTRKFDNITNPSQGGHGQGQRRKIFTMLVSDLLSLYQETTAQIFRNPKFTPIYACCKALARNRRVTMSGVGLSTMRMRCMEIKHKSAHPGCRANLQSFLRLTFANLL
ncbi:uncharacterized protein LY89DRAFT_372228 [Mollisia scopiformis]|uniref:Uncharacterized protein n=1 Tax=Mollisia scopiformis TaxID=149040 RepID=A0A132B3E3_MOLSC|nr:uncharacterized protein LY89DRAFT_372228 [Mollisia scopiformis]KUJ06916.1 hypothetical protein LY89DRAFT_372228 [Mollisia scopiformis]